MAVASTTEAASAITASATITTTITAEGGWGWWRWGGPRYYHGSPGYYAYRRIWGCACFWISFLVVVVFAAVSVGALVGPASRSSERRYTPGDTRLVTVDSTFCSGVSVSGNNVLLEATLYALSRPPALTSWNNFTLQESSVSVPFQGHVSYQFYLHRGSTVNGTNCISAGSSLQLLIIKGTFNFNSWVDRPRSSRSLRSYLIAQTCPSGSNSFSFQPTEDGYYFFVYYNSLRSSARVTVDLQFFRTQYTMNPSNVLHSCLYDGVVSCRISTAAGATYVLAVDDERSSLANSNFNVACKTSSGIIAVIVLIPLLVLAVIVGVIIVLACYCHYKYAKKAAVSTISIAPSAADPMVQPAHPEAPSTATVVSVTTNTPPAYNPSYPTALPPYSSVAPTCGSTAEKS